MMKYTKFLSVYDVLISLLPSVASTLGVVPYFESPWVPLVIGAVILVIVLAVLIESNLKKKENALAEIVATGYFINFLEPLTKNIGKTNEVIFKDHDTRKSYELKDISIRIFLPGNSRSLMEIADDLNDNPEYTNIDIINAKDGTPFWARAREAEGHLTIVDFPRTLFSLPRFVKINVGSDDSDKLDRYYECFRAKLQELLDDNRQDYVLRRVELVQI